MRSCVLALQDGLSSHWEERIASAGIAVRPVGSAEALLAELAAGAEPVDALIIGPAADRPLNLVQRVRQRDRDLSVLLYLPEAALEAFRQDASVSPFVGENTQVLGEADLAALPVVLLRALGETRDRRRRRETLHALSARIAASPPARPQPTVLLDRMLELAPVGVLVADAGGRIQVSNRKAAEILSVEPGALLQARLEDVLPDAPTELAPGERRSMERKDGERRQFLGVSVASVPEPGGATSRLIVLEDETERVLWEKERQSLLEGLQDAVRMRDEFLSLASHELRTPLTAILGWVQLLRRGGLPPEKHDRALATVERSARAQARLVEDLLDASRIISGKLRLNVEPVSLDQVVREAVESALPSANAKGVALVTVLDTGLGASLGDRHRLLQVVWNLLSNAVRFTPKGGRISVHLRREQSTAELVVRDTGVGIPAAFLPHVFERFRQVDSSSTREHGGLGLGLSIVQHLVQLHGGKVEAASEGEGKGATFTVRLPIAALCAEACPTSEEGPAVEPPPAAIQGLKALVVEDEPDVRAFLVSALVRSGLSVREAASVQEALASLEEEVPEIIISDIEMPGGTGYALMREVRRLPAARGGRVPAIAITAHARPQDRREALLAGFQQHVTKPVGLEELLLTIAALAGRA